MSAGPTAFDAGAGAAPPVAGAMAAATAVATDIARAPSAQVGRAGPVSPPAALAATAEAATAAKPETASIRVDLLNRIAKRVDIVAEMQRRNEARLAACRKCGGRADYRVVYDGLVNKMAAANVCEACMEETVIHDGGREIYPWKRDIVSMECIRCGDDVTQRGWCVCPGNARRAAAAAAAAAGNGNDGGRHGRAQEAVVQ